VLTHIGSVPETTKISSKLLRLAINNQTKKIQPEQENCMFQDSQ